MIHLRRFCVALAFISLLCRGGYGQAYGEPATRSPGDQMIQEYLRVETEKIAARFPEQLSSRGNWEQGQRQRRFEYLYMLGLWPEPPRTDLQATVTGSYRGDGFVVDKLHFQSRPQLYVTANLYRPAEDESGVRRPAVLYVCGHSHRGRDGNKTAYQSHGIWFARHGYVCLMLDTLQLGEIAAIHHGTYREQRWWWHSRGYTSAGVECWNGVRALDYLVGRADVDPERLAVTGISGGGAATFWIAAADPRVRVAVPVSGMADLHAYVPNRVVNGHCDCMFLYNTFQWPWTRIAAMIAPRPLLFVNSDADSIFPMDANERVINRLERVYSLFGAGDAVDAFVSIGGHAYREDIRRASYEFLNRHLKHDVSPVLDSEVDLVTGPRERPEHPIPPEALRVFPSDAEIPQDQLNTTIDEVFVPLAEVQVPSAEDFAIRKNDLLQQLRRFAFAYFPRSIPPAQHVEGAGDGAAFETEPGIVVTRPQLAAPENPQRVVLRVASADSSRDLPDWLATRCREDDAVYSLEPRGIGGTRWTTDNPPNYVERSHVLLGRTVDTGRVWDVIATARRLRQEHPETPVVVAGSGTAAIIAAYAVLLDEGLSGAILRAPQETHMDSSAPQLLNVLRVCDVPDAIGFLAPRKLEMIVCPKGLADKVAQFYEAAGASEQLTISE